MPRQQNPTQSISEIRVDPKPSGLRAVYMIETRSSDEAHEITGLFGDLESQMQVRQLSKGKLVSYAVQADEADSEILDEIENVLKKNYGFVVTQRSFDEIIYRIVKDLCKDTGSKLLPISQCNICGRTEPFPSLVVSLADDDGSIRICRNYCASCTAGTTAPSNKEFVRSLLAADKQDFSEIEHAELVRRPSRNQPIRFRIKSAI